MCTGLTSDFLFREKFPFANCFPLVNWCRISRTSDASAQASTRRSFLEKTLAILLCHFISFLFQDTLKAASLLDSRAIKKIFISILIWSKQSLKSESMKLNKFGSKLVENIAIFFRFTFWFQAFLSFAVYFIDWLSFSHQISTYPVPQKVSLFLFSSDVARDMFSSYVTTKDDIFTYSAHRRKIAQQVWHCPHIRCLSWAKSVRSLACNLFSTNWMYRHNGRLIPMCSGKNNTTCWKMTNC